MGASGVNVASGFAVHGDKAENLAIHLGEIYYGSLKCGGAHGT